MKHDIYMGILEQWKKFVVIIVIFGMIGSQLFARFSCNTATLNLTKFSLSFGDYILYAFRGMKVFCKSDKGFTVNVIWIMYNVYLAYIVSDYPFRDLTGYGQIMLLYSKKRSYWWISKCIWNITSVFIFYLLAYGTLAICSIITGEISLCLFPHTTVQLGFSQMNTEGISQKTILIISFILPLITSISISLLQMTISLILQPILGIVSVAGMLVASAFYCTYWLPGNYLMIMRNEQILPGSGINLISGVVLSISIFIISVVVGLFYLPRKDILIKEK